MYIIYFDALLTLSVPYVFIRTNKRKLKTIVLKLLSETKQMYGYAITQKVKELTDSKIVITEGALYLLLHQPEAEGVVTTEIEIN